MTRSILDEFEKPSSPRSPTQAEHNTFLHNMWAPVDGALCRYFLDGFGSLRAEARPYQGGWYINLWVGHSSRRGAGDTLRSSRKKMHHLYGAAFDTAKQAAEAGARELKRHEGALRLAGSL